MIIGSVVGAAAALALLAGLVGLVFWVRRKRREESVRNLSDLGALPGTVSIPDSRMRARLHCCHICMNQLLVTRELWLQIYCSSEFAALSVIVVAGLLPGHSAGFTSRIVAPVCPQESCRQSKSSLGGLEQDPHG